MNRANFGNVITNGMQVLSVSGTSANRFLGRADTALNNLSAEERSQYFQMQADKMRDEVRDYNSQEGKAFRDMKIDKRNDQVVTYNNKGESPMQHLSQEERTAYQEKKAEGIRNYIKDDSSDGDDSSRVEQAMSDMDGETPNYELNSEQIKEIQTKLANDRRFILSYRSKSGKIVKRDDFMKEIEQNANV